MKNFVNLLDLKGELLSFCDEIIELLQGDFLQGIPDELRGMTAHVRSIESAAAGHAEELLYLAADQRAETDAAEVKPILASVATD